MAPPRQDTTAGFIFNPRMRHDAEKTHPLAGRAFYIRPTGEKAQLLLGRSSSCDITIPDVSVSETHCLLKITHHGVTLQDLASRNGTSVNMRRLESNCSFILADEDILSIGRYSFQLISSGTFYQEMLPLVDIS
jgi:pSer/pThr/pTyr-binding forkhead associated (FHA) protein